MFINIIHKNSIMKFKIFIFLILFVIVVIGCSSKIGNTEKIIEIRNSNQTIIQTSNYANQTDRLDITDENLPICPSETATNCRHIENQISAGNEDKKSDKSNSQNNWLKNRVMGMASFNLYPQ